MKNQINRDSGEVMRDEMVMKDRILSGLNEEPMTIPELAAQLEYPAADVLFWVMALWRYGAIEEVGKADKEGFYKYRPVKQDLS